MVKQIKVNSFEEVKEIVTAATKCADEVGVHDAHGTIADAKSILGLMSLDYTKPVLVVSESEYDLNLVANSIVRS